GFNFLGFPRDSAVLTGMFDANQRLGLVLALFLPLALYALRERGPNSNWKWVVLLPYAVVVLLSLKRSAWLMLAVGLTVWVVFFLRMSALSWRAKIFGPVAVLLVIAGTSYFVPSVGKTLQTTLSALNSDYETLDIATSRRLTLWDTGARIFKSSPVTGIGPRGYRYAYNDFAAPNDYWIARHGKGQTHPHLMGLEVLVETGLVGLLGLIMFFVFVFRAMWARRGRDSDSVVWLALAVVAWFPLNVHLAFYGSYWSSFAWLFIAIGAAIPANTLQDPA
ncbi:MAG: O-antigen ligase family protein, partial [Pseudomonadota bacterium]